MNSIDFCRALVVMVAGLAAFHGYGDETFSNYYGTFSFSIRNGEAYISKVVPGKSTAVQFPGVLQGCPVVAIGNNAMDYRSDDTLSKITEVDFYGCNQLRTIGDCAFRGCPNLRIVSLPNSLERIGSFAFADTSNLVSFASLPMNCVSIGEGAFRNCTSLGDIELPARLETLGSYAFNGCSSLTNLTFEGAPPAVGNDVFGGVSGACRVTVNLQEGWPKKPRYYPITPWAWNGLTVATLPQDEVTVNGIKYTYSRVADRATILKVEIPEGVTTVTTPDRLGGYTVCSLGRNSFALDSNSTMGSVTKVTVDSQVRRIGNTAFSRCNKLNEVCFKTDDVTIGVSAFLECTALTSVSWQETDGKRETHYATLPPGVKTVSECLFYGCTKLGELTLPDAVETIGESAFEGCRALTSLVVPSNVTEIGHSAFANCRSLHSVVFRGDCPDYLGTNLFANVTSCCLAYAPRESTGWNPLPYSANWHGIRLASSFERDGVTFAYDGYNGNIKLLGVYAKGVQAAAIPYDLGPSGTKFVRIDDHAFDVSRNVTEDLRSVYIPGGVAAIGEGAFSNCSNVLAITIMSQKPPTVGNGAFEGLSSNVRFFVNDLATGWENPLPTTWQGFQLSPAFVEDMVTYGYAYTKTGTAKLIKVEVNRNSEMEVVLPGEVGGVAVTELGNGMMAAYGNDTHLVTGVYVPASVTAVGASAFASCELLEFVKFAGNAPTFGEGWLRSTPYSVDLYVHRDSMGWSVAFANWPAKIPGEMKVSDKYGVIKVCYFPGEAPDQTGFELWATQNGLSGADAAWDACPAKWGGHIENAFVYTYGEELADGMIRLIGITLDADGAPVVTTASVIEGHTDFAPAVVGSLTLDDWTKAVALDNDGNDWTLPKGKIARFFRIRLTGPDLIH